MSRYNFAEAEAKWQAIWEQRRCFVGARRRLAAQVLRAGDVSLSVRAHPHGSRPQLHAGRRRRPVQAGARVQRAASDGLGCLRPAGGECGDRAWRAPRRMDAPEHRHDAAAAQARSGCPTTGLASSLLAIRNITGMSRRCFSTSSRPVSSTAARPGSTGIRSRIRCSPTSRSIDGKGWRSGALVERRKLAQWFLKITAFADELLAALSSLDRWPERVRLMQENWIGRSEGARVLFRLKGRSDRLEVYTTRPDTLFGASFCAIAADHPLAVELAGKDPALAAFIADMQPWRDQRSCHRNPGEARLRHRPAGAAPVRLRLGAAGLCRQLRADRVRHRGHLRLPGARSARPGFRSRLRLAGGSGGRSGRRGSPSHSRSTTSPILGPGRLINSRFLDGLRRRGGEAGGYPAVEGGGCRRARRELSVA